MCLIESIRKATPRNSKSVTVRGRMLLAELLDQWSLTTPSKEELVTIIELVSTWKLRKKNVVKATVDEQNIIGSYALTDGSLTIGDFLLTYGAIRTDCVLSTFAIYINAFDKELFVDGPVTDSGKEFYTDIMLKWPVVIKSIDTLNVKTRLLETVRTHVKSRLSWNEWDDVEEEIEELCLLAYNYMLYGKINNILKSFGKACSKILAGIPEVKPGVVSKLDPMAAIDCECKYCVSDVLSGASEISRRCESSDVGFYVWCYLMSNAKATTAASRGSTVVKWENRILPAGRTGFESSCDSISIYQLIKQLRTQYNHLVDYG